MPPKKVDAFPTADVDRDFVRLACFGVYDDVKTLLEAGKAQDEAGDDGDDEKVPFDVNQKDAGGNTAVAWACRNDHLKVAKYLVEQGADIEMPTSGGLRPLHHAVNMNRENVVAFLLEANADVNAGDSGGSTALHWSASRGVMNIIVRLIEKSADVNACNGAV